MAKVSRPIVNLLSDTVTRPNAVMRQVMAAADVGDDVLGADPSVKRLEDVAAARLGKAAALYVPSGTMANLIAIGTHCRRGDEVICGNRSHIFLYEGGGANAYMGVSFHTVSNQPDGTMRLRDMEQALRSDDPHYPRSRLVAIENTQNACGGRVLPLSYLRDVESFCKERHLRLHVDGARLANASVASKIPMHELVREADSVSLCLSKGLGAPVGSLLAGSNEFVQQARRLRKSLGGGMRQAGIIASAGLYALENQFDRLAQDHVTAQAFAHGLSSLPGIEVNPATVDTNIVFFTVTPDAKLDATTLVQRLEAEKGVLLGGYRDFNRVRAVTNLHISKHDVDYAVSSIQALLS
ncbi:hypothetical protein PsorP6_009428 [Peronosclerospora sorghi]|uniref:Uncharacterized protein n=1 Tax=Peronosclerospora sorghi TaxID=230839 RepID=A0ACC0VXA5_9STRA|nr:hypothetical protein PsorP6_009428 [Peronosclerospora sorghi]